MSEHYSDGAAETSSAAETEELHKYIAPISGGRNLYFYTFGDEKLELPPDAVLVEASGAANV